MMRVEKIVREKDIAHEISTYNELIGNDGEIGGTLLIEIDDPDKRDVLLREWLALPEHLFAELADGTRCPAIVDERQVGDDRLSSVQYLRFDVHGQAPVAILSTLPVLEIRSELTDAQRTALQEDLDAR